MGVKLSPNQHYPLTCSHWSSCVTILHKCKWQHKEQGSGEAGPILFPRHGHRSPGPFSLLFLFLIFIWMTHSNLTHLQIPQDQRRGEPFCSDQFSARLSKNVLESCQSQIMQFPLKLGKSPLSQAVPVTTWIYTKIEYSTKIKAFLML